MQGLGAMQGRRPRDLARGGGWFRAGLACPSGLLAGEVDADEAAVQAKRRARGRALLRGARLPCGFGVRESGGRGGRGATGWPEGRGRRRVHWHGARRTREALSMGARAKELRWGSAMQAGRGGRGRVRRSRHGRARHRQRTAREALLLSVCGGEGDREQGFGRHGRQVWAQEEGRVRGARGGRRGSGAMGDGVGHWRRRRDERERSRGGGFRARVMARPGLRPSGLRGRRTGRPGLSLSSLSHTFFNRKELERRKEREG